MAEEWRDSIRTKDPPRVIDLPGGWGLHPKFSFLGVVQRGFALLWSRNQICNSLIYQREETLLPQFL